MCVKFAIKDFLVILIWITIYGFTLERSLFHVRYATKNSHKNLIWMVTCVFIQGWNPSFVRFATKGFLIKLNWRIICVSIKDRILSLKRMKGSISQNLTLNIQLYFLNEVISLSLRFAVKTFLGGIT